MTQTNNAINAEGIPAVVGQSLTGVLNGKQYIFANIPGRNRLVNGNNKVWQRKLGAMAMPLSADAKYTADRWQLKNTGSNCTVTPVAGLTFSGAKGIKVQRNATDGGTAVIALGQTLTQSACSNANSNKWTIQTTVYSGGADFSASGKLLTVAVKYNTDGSSETSGFGGAGSWNNTLFTTTVALTAIRQDIIFTTDVPPNNVTQMQLVYSYLPTATAGANDWFCIENESFELGQNPTPFQDLSFEEQYMDCLFYYCSSFNYGTTPANNLGLSAGAVYGVATTAAGNPLSMYVPYTRPLRVAPGLSGSNIITLYNPNTGGDVTHNGQILNATIPVSSGSTEITTNAGDTGAYNRSGFNVRAVSGAGTVVSNSTAIAYTADAELY